MKNKNIIVRSLGLKPGTFSISKSLICDAVFLKVSNFVDHSRITLQFLNYLKANELLKTVNKRKKKIVRPLEFQPETVGISTITFFSQLLKTTEQVSPSNFHLSGSNSFLVMKSEIKFKPAAIFQKNNLLEKIFRKIVADASAPINVFTVLSAMNNIFIFERKCKINIRCALLDGKRNRKGLCRD